MPHEDWFDKQLSETPHIPHQCVPTTNEGETRDLRPSRKAVQFTLTVRNKTFYRWKVTIEGSRSSSDHAATTNEPSMSVEPNTDLSQKLVSSTIRMNELFHVKSIDAVSNLSETGRMVLTTHAPMKFEYHRCQSKVDLNVTIDWCPSTTLYGHMVPCIKSEAIHLRQRTESGH